MELPSSSIPACPPRAHMGSKLNVRNAKHFASSSQSQHGIRITPKNLVPPRPTAALGAIEPEPTLSRGRKESQKTIVQPAETTGPLRSQNPSHFQEVIRGSRVLSCPLQLRVNLRASPKLGTEENGTACLKAAPGLLNSNIAI